MSDPSYPIPFHEIDISFNPNNLSLTFKISLEYMGYSQASKDDDDLLGTTYVIDFSSTGMGPFLFFSFLSCGLFEKQTLADIGTLPIDENMTGSCQNRNYQSYENKTWTEFWLWSAAPYIPGNLGSSDYLAYPPLDGTNWEVYIENASVDNPICTPVTYEASFTWDELWDCLDIEGDRTMTFTDDGTFYILEGHVETLKFHLFCPKNTPFLCRV